MMTIGEIYKGREMLFAVVLFFFFQAEDGIRDFCLSRGLGDVYKRQVMSRYLINGCLKNW